MKTRSATWGLALLTLVNVTALATIGYHRLRPHSARHDLDAPPQIRLLDGDLGLSGEQEAQLSLLRDSFQAKIEPIRTSLSAGRQELVGLLTLPETDRNQVEELLGRINSLQTEMQRAVIDHLLAEKAILTPEQQSTFLARIRESLVGEGAHGMQDPVGPR